ncbi:hypothetical protein HHI36_023198 [Cryptolaemus montrouzieri]|uniref:Kazal-like domain-containing protein n=1 Tax=Cryptolaemus montrouzieri TaxID=559131 RepID=A0ABD2PGL1_9CUCU
MIHPSDLLRSDSRSKEFAAPLHLQGKKENDWGISILPCLAKVFNWRTFAKPSVFVAILSLIGCSQGFLLYYFRNTADIWPRQYDISKKTVDWLIYINEFSIGLLALPLAHWANVTHKIVWISLVTIVHGIFSVFLFVPERFLAKSVSISNSTVHLCDSSTPSFHDDPQIGVTITIIAYQVLTAASSISFFSIGLVYVDDNSPKNRSTVLAIALASRQIGQQLGIYASWIPNFTNIHDIFRSFVWQGVSVVCILLGVCIAMFPKVLPSLLIKELAASLLEIASGISTSDLTEPKSDGFLVSIGRIIKNKIIILSIISTVAIQTALINFGIFENYFKQSRFFIADDFEESGYTNVFSANFVTNVMEKPFTILCTIVTGLVISRSNIKVKYLVLWNVMMFAVCTLLFSSYLFIKCEYEDVTQLIPSCSVDCGCRLEGTFNPVCLKGRTYYSPCHAGCKVVERSGDYQFYKDCSCASFEGMASEGSCHADKCNMMYQLTQVNKVIAEGFLATTELTTIVIVLRSVRSTDKSLALGLEMALLSLVPFLPVRTGYEYIASKLCRYSYHGRCKIYSQEFSLFLSNITVMLLIFGTVVQMFLLCIDLDNPTRNKKKRTFENSDISSEKKVSMDYSTEDNNHPESQKLIDNINSEGSRNDFSTDFDSLGDDHDSDLEEYIDMKNQNGNEQSIDNSDVLESHL